MFLFVRNTLEEFYFQRKRFFIVKEQNFFAILSEVNVWLKQSKGKQLTFNFMNSLNFNFSFFLTSSRIIISFISLLPLYKQHGNVLLLSLCCDCNMSIVICKHCNFRSECQYLYESHLTEQQCEVR